MEIGAAPEESQVEATIDMSSVTSGNKARDDHLRSPDFFDVATWPTASFRSTDLTWSGTAGTMKGLLTIKDVTRVVTLDVEYLGYVRDPWNTDRAAFDAVGRINREDWGLTWNVALDSGGVVVSKDITLEFHVELIKAE